MSIENFVESAIKDNKVIIFSKSYCPYCQNAKNILGRFPKVELKVFELDDMEEGSEIQAYLLKKTGQPTVPNVFINEKHIGGSDRVVELKKRGELKALIESEPETEPEPVVETEPEDEEDLSNASP